MNQTELYSPHFYLVSTEDVIEIKPPCVIGRTKGEIQIKDSKLSSLHCEFSVKGIRLFIKDLNSTNGTFVNREKLNPNEEVEVQLNDQIQIGTHLYSLHLEKPNLKKVSSSIDSSSPVKILSLRGILSFYGASLPSKIMYFLIITFTVLGEFFNHNGIISLYSVLLIVFMVLFAFSFCLCLSYLKTKYLKESFFFSSIASLISLPIFFILYFSIQPVGSNAYHSKKYSSELKPIKKRVISNERVLRLYTRLEKNVLLNLESVTDLSDLNKELTVFKGHLSQLDPKQHADVIKEIHSKYTFLSNNIKKISSHRCPQEHQACNLLIINSELVFLMDHKLKNNPPTTVDTVKED